MSQYDVTTDTLEEIDVVKFGPRLPREARKAYEINGTKGGGNITMRSPNNTVMIQGSDVDMLIKALQKAKELGWTTKPESTAESF